jgi:hypothetical protein
MGWLLGIAVPVIVLSVLGLPSAVGLLTGWPWSDWLAVPWAVFNGGGSAVMALLALSAGSDSAGNLGLLVRTLPLVGATSAVGSMAVLWLIVRGAAMPQPSPQRPRRMR